MSSRSIARVFHAAGVYLVAVLVCGCGRQSERQAPSGSPEGAGLRDTCYTREAANTSGLLGFAATDGAGEAGDDGIGERLAEGLREKLARGLPAGVRVERATVKRSTGAWHFDFRYYVGNYPVCDGLARAHIVGGKLLVDNAVGRRLSQLGEVDPSALVWPDPAETLAAAARSLAVAPAAAAIRQQATCVAVAPGGLLAAWDLTVQLGPHPYRVLGSGTRVLVVDPRFDEVTGSARVYRKNPQDGELVDLPLPDLTSPEELKSSRFSLVLPTGFASPRSTDGHFDFAQTDIRFGEASLFAHVEDMAAWFMQPEHGYTFDCVPIDIRPHAKRDPFGYQMENNAEYVVPEMTENGYPAIYVGEGDGQSLQGLELDFDVVAHELGHHIVYRKLKSQADESGVIHEALADYFVFARTGNACLGESICPAGSPLCQVDGQCLRTADNKLRLDDPELPRERHQRSQFISGMLWDLGRSPGLSQPAVATLVMKAIAYFQTSMSYGDLVKALMAADLELNRGTHACAIMDAAKARGLASELGGVDCQSYVAAS